MAGKSYYEELAREFAGFMLPVLNSKSSMIALTDAYCLFNRARGVGKYYIIIQYLSYGIGY